MAVIIRHTVGSTILKKSDFLFGVPDVASRCRREHPSAIKTQVIGRVGSPLKQLSPRQNAGASPLRVFGYHIVAPSIRACGLVFVRSTFRNAPSSLCVPTAIPLKELEYDQNNHRVTNVFAYSRFVFAFTFCFVYQQRNAED